MSSEEQQRALRRQYVADLETIEAMEPDLVILGEALEDPEARARVRHG